MSRMLVGPCPNHCYMTLICPKTITIYIVISSYSLIYSTLKYCSYVVLACFAQFTTFRCRSNRTRIQRAKVDPKLLNRIKSKCDENLRGAFLWELTGDHRRRRSGDPPGRQKGPWRGPPPGRARHPPGCLVAPLGAPSRL